MTFAASNLFVFRECFNSFIVLVMFDLGLQCSIMWWDLEYYISSDFLMEIVSFVLFLGS